MKGNLESAFKGYKKTQTMASSIAPAMPANGSVDVGINGPIAWPLGIGPTSIAPPRLRLVRALSKPDQTAKAASATRLNF